MMPPRSIFRNGFCALPQVPQILSVRLVATVEFPRINFKKGSAWIVVLF